MNTEPFSEDVDQGAQLTSYDLAHLRLYLQLLDVEAEGRLDWKQIAQLLFGIDAQAECGRARRLYTAHRQRARWMTEHGYRQLAALGRFDIRHS